MKDKTQATTKADSHRKKFRAGMILIFIVVAAVIAAILLRPPERSVAAFCKVQKEENAKLTHEGGDKFRVAIFTSSSDDPSKFAAAFGKLERVAPEDIKQDVKTLKSVFEKIDKDPSQKLGASLSGLGAESNVKDWTKENCRG